MLRIAMPPGHDHADFQRVRSPFEGRLVRLRAVEDEDLPRLHEMLWDPAVTEHLEVVWPESLDGYRAWLEGRRRDDRTYLFTVETLPGEPMGVCDLRVRDRSRTGVLGIWIGRPHWDQGFGTDAVRTLCRFGFREANLQRIELDVYDTNPRGRRTYEHVGFKEEGRRRRAIFLGGRYVDAVTMGLLAEDLIED